LPLNVVITRRTFDGPVDGPHERALIASIMKLLCPHIHRFQQLHFDVMLSSSLPSFPNDFHGTATILTTLRLECREDDGVPIHSNNNRESVDPTQHESFQCPDLSMLIIDGRNCYNAYKRGVRWTGELVGLYDLTIAHFRPQPGESLSAYDILYPLTTMKQLEAVCIADLSFGGNGLRPPKS
jgi:hypothetical protein